MSQRTMTITVCDGCGTRNLDADGVFQHHKEFGAIEGFKKRVDICVNCYDKERYICKQCESVHDDAHMCEGLKDLQYIPVYWRWCGVTRGPSKTHLTTKEGAPFLKTLCGLTMDTDSEGYSEFVYNRTIATCTKCVSVKKAREAMYV